MDGENIFECAIVAFGPNVIASPSVDELCNDADAVTTPAHAAFQHVPYTQLAAYRFNIDRTAFVSEAGVAGDHKSERLLDSSVMMSSEIPSEK